MIKINLFPAELEVAPTHINPMIPLGIAVILPMVFLVPTHLTQVAAHKHLQTETASLKSELDRYQPIIAQVEALENAKTQLTQRKSVIEQLQNERLRYPQFMDDFLKLLPGNLWLTNLSTIIVPGTNNMTVSMDIVALDNYAVADLVANLETSQIFSDVDLGTLSVSQPAGGGQSIGFHVNATYKKMNPIPDAIKKS